MTFLVYLPISYVNQGCVPLGGSGLGSVMQDNLDQGHGHSLVPMMHYDLSELGSLILIQMHPRKQLTK